MDGNQFIELSPAEYRTVRESLLEDWSRCRIDTPTMQKMLAELTMTSALDDIDINFKGEE